ncbi:hypothetical protein L226DRAFT_565053 [Lentinus tigrinus ALCF2SS1-7]|uniref:Uncharacterized protein n=1 Tax=Lentinus tigrinus ALCF2SS1-6 TaxID=1328759 RepID=A0A5C2RXL0_9APHY|nr:hypothetical protein L227DRAFT_579286 [Lentinus tigrinus ALCF2SS1-6]RPD82487.1 hypothetical protein L226DRAFT_565053 [Lentinus tigrinus ALCF2SS1-7]
MASSRPANPRLNYYQQSPVRGQLENPDGTTRSGWRYVQCTDTPNELRVLIPPRTALIYSHLLKAEVAELGKDHAANWERIVEIRHLKDRMIRKCTRLSRETTSKDKAAAHRVMFQTVHAPPDFRLKEMERWFKLQGGEVAKAAPEPAAGTYCRDCKECMAHQARMQAYAHNQASVRRVPSSSKQVPPAERTARRQPAPSNPYAQLGPVHPSQSQRARGPAPPRGHVRQASMPAAPGYHPPGSHTAEGRKSSEYLRVEHAARPYVRSPDPLPIPYRTRARSASPDRALSTPTELGDSPVHQVLELPLSSSPVPAPSPSPRESPSITPPKVSTPPNGLPTIHEDQEHEGHRPIVRRRSSLKKRDSMSRISVASQSKSVAWAMDRDWVDQMSQYIKTSNEAEVLSAELEKLRVEYHDEIEAMRALCLRVEESQERVRLETDNLRRNEQAVKLQENKILASSEQIELKQAEFQAKVLSVLEESKRVVQLCDKKRDMHDSS